MKADKKEIFKKVIKLADDENPTADFSASVMKTIEADFKREVNLKALLQREEASGPSFNFTASVMAGIEASQPQYVYKPIIAKKAWYGIAFLILVFLTIIFASNKPGYSSASQTRMTSLIDYISKIPVVYLMAMVVIMLLLTADYLVSRKNYSKKVNSPA